MVQPADCAVIIPCFNEAGNIGRLVSQVRSHLPCVLVVDDGSRDDTSKIARANGAEIIRHETNCGKGAALRAGWDFAAEKGFKFALSLDGDGQHSPDDIPAFLSQMSHRNALLVGNRMADASQMPLLRRFVNQWMTRRLSKLAGIPLLDSQCGFRMVNLKALQNVEISSWHFEIESELIAAFARQGLPIDFIKVQTIYNGSKSRINPLVDGIRWVRWWMGQAGQQAQLRTKEPSNLRPLITNP